MMMVLPRGPGTSAPPRPRSSRADPPSAELAQHAGSTRAGHRRTASSPAGSSSGDDELRNLRAASSSRRPRGQAAYGRRACSWKWAGRCLTPALCSRVELTRIASDVGPYVGRHSQTGARSERAAKAGALFFWVALSAERLLHHPIHDKLRTAALQLKRLKSTYRNHE